MPMIATSNPTRERVYDSTWCDDTIQRIVSNQDSNLGIQFNLFYIPLLAFLLIPASTRSKCFPIKSAVANIQHAGRNRSNEANFPLAVSSPTPIRMFQNKKTTPGQIEPLRPLPSVIWNGLTFFVVIIFDPVIRIPIPD